MKKLRKQSIVMIMALVMLLFLSGQGSAGSMIVNAEEEKVTVPVQNSDGYYELYTKEDLEWFADLVNGTNGQTQNTAANAILMDDIVLNENLLTQDGALYVTDGDSIAYESWTPIGTGTAQYNGIFDGNNHIISGLYINAPTENNQGLFGYIGSNGKVQNLGMKDTYLCAQYYMAAVCGNNRGTITNCFHQGRLTVGKESGMYTGAIVGNNYGLVDSCYNEATLMQEKSDIQGYYSVYLAGICGYNNSESNNGGVVSNCYNTGDIKHDGVYAAGICAYNGWRIEDCYNTGKITAGLGASGICSSNMRLVIRCYNMGQISADGSAAGITPWSYGAIVNCYNEGTIQADYDAAGICSSINVGESGYDIRNCYNRGTIEGERTSGSIVGTVSGTNVGNIENCYYLDSTLSDAYGIAMTEDQFASGQITWSLAQGEGELRVWVGGNGYYTYDGSIWNQTIGTDKWPVMSTDSQKVYQSTPCTSVYTNDSAKTAKEHPGYANDKCIDCGLPEVPPTDENGVYLLDSAYDLKWFSTHVNQVDSTISAKLMADIVFNEGVLNADGSLNGQEPDYEQEIYWWEETNNPYEAWVPIGNEYVGYSGTFDGNGHTISGLYYADNNTRFTGFFGVVDGGIITNLTIEDSYFSGAREVGVVCAYLNAGEIIGCTNKSTVTVCRPGSILSPRSTQVINYDSYYQNAAGICGSSTYGGQIKNCINEGTITTTKEASDTNCAGIVGQTDGLVEGCVNKGNINGYCAGGICYTSGYENQESIVRNCYNEGTVTADYDAGGVVCYGNIVVNCYNIGAINCDYAGGIVSYATEYDKIVNCYNMGKLQGSNVGGICGWDEGATIYNSYYVKTIDTDPSEMAKTSEQFSSGEVAWLLSQGYTDGKNEYFGEVWGQTLGTDRYPVLNGTDGDKVYKSCEDGTYHNTEKHVYSQGLCVVCEAYEDITEIRLLGYNCSLNGNVAMNFYFTLPDAVMDDPDSYMQFYVGKRNAGKVYVEDVIKNGSVDQYDMVCYAFTCEVAAKEMTETITAQMILSDGTKGKEYTYTIKEYADYILENKDSNDEYASSANLVDAMLDYGTYCQEYFENNTDKPANGEVSEEDKQETEAKLATVTTEKLKDFKSKTGQTLPEGLTYYATSLILESETTIRHYFKVAEVYDSSSYEFKLGDKILTLKKWSDYYYVEIPNIKATDLGTLYKVEVGDWFVEYSALSYADSILEREQFKDDIALQNVVKAMYLYYEAAKTR